MEIGILSSFIQNNNYNSRNKYSHFKNQFPHCILYPCRITNQGLDKKIERRQICLTKQVLSTSWVLMSLLILLFLIILSQKLLSKNLVNESYW